MPVPCHDISGTGSPGAVGWLRFVGAPGGRGVRAALFETSVRGDPLGFSFGFSFDRTARQDATGENALLSLTKSLFRSSAATPALLFGLADEMPSRRFDTLRIELPFCRVHPASVAPKDAAAGMAPDGPGMLWVTGPPAPESGAGRILAGIMRWDDPFEPLQRAARGLAEAFTDPRVQALTTISGLRTVIALPPRLEDNGMQVARTSATPAPAPVAAVEEHAEPGLSERLWAVLAAPRPALPPSPPPPDKQLGWPCALMPFQHDGVQALVSLERLLLSDDMGLGKTVQAIAALRILRVRGEIESCLVVAPAGVLDQWRRELARWAPELSAIIIRGSADDRAWQWRAGTDVTLVSYDLMRSDAGLLAACRAPVGLWDVVVLDEAQKIKNRNDTSEAAKSIPRTRSWALTGTPIENDEEELASIMEFVGHDQGRPRQRYRPGAALQLRHAELQLRRKKEDVLDELPPKLETRLLIPLHREQRESYEKAEREGIVYLRSLGAEVGVRHVLELITRLKQICNADPRTGVSSKLDDIADRLETLAAQGHKALVFSQYTSNTAGVAAAANHLRSFNPLTLTGDMPAERRADIINRFKAGDTHKALLISLRAGGLGLNLQEASYVFHLDRWWNPALERQAEDRTHRMGQTVKVNVLKYTCEDTIEERIDRILERKQALFERLVDDVSMDLSTRMSRNELLGLFGLE